MQTVHELTAKQQRILDFIQGRIENGRPPTVREIGVHFDIKSPNGVMCHLQALEKKGAITREGFRACGIRLNGKTSPWRTIGSAPRDGTAVDLWARGVRFPDAYWNLGNWYDCDGLLTPEPSHWMPIPEGPSDG